MKVYIVETTSYVQYEGSWSTVRFASTDKDEAIKAFQGWSYKAEDSSDGTNAHLYEMNGSDRKLLLAWYSNTE